MTKSRDKLPLLHIRDAIDKILEYSRKINFAELAKGNESYDAILMQLVIIGEAVNNLSSDFKERNPDLPWYEAVGLRNRIAHGYVDVKPEVVWDTIKKDIPKLKIKIDRLLKDF